MTPRAATSWGMSHICCRPTSLIGSPLACWIVHSAWAVYTGACWRKRARALNGCAITSGTAATTARRLPPAAHPKSWSTARDGASPRVTCWRRSLRANNIPAGLCYQRLRRDASPGFSLHGLSAAFLPKYGWYRLDPRGNKPGIDAQFAPPHEQLAWSADASAGEEDLPGVWAAADADRG